MARDKSFEVQPHSHMAGKIDPVAEFGLQRVPQSRAIYIKAIKNIYLKKHWPW